MSLGHNSKSKGGGGGDVARPGLTPSKPAPHGTHPPSSLTVTWRDDKSGGGVMKDREQVRLKTTESGRKEEENNSVQCRGVTTCRSQICDGSYEVFFVSDGF